MVMTCFGSILTTISGFYESFITEININSRLNLHAAWSGGKVK